MRTSWQIDLKWGAGLLACLFVVATGSALWITSACTQPPSMRHDRQEASSPEDRGRVKGAQLASVVANLWGVVWIYKFDQTQYLGLHWGGL